MQRREPRSNSAINQKSLVANLHGSTLGLATAGVKTLSTHPYSIPFLHAYHVRGTQLPPGLFYDGGPNPLFQRISSCIPIQEFIFFLHDTRLCRAVNNVFSAREFDCARPRIVKRWCRTFLYCRVSLVIKWLCWKRRGKHLDSSGMAKIIVCRRSRAARKLKNNSNDMIVLKANYWTEQSERLREPPL